MVNLVSFERNLLDTAAIELLERAFNHHFDILRRDCFSFILPSETVGEHAATEVIEVGRGLFVLGDTLQCLFLEGLWVLFHEVCSTNLFCNIKRTG